MGHKKWMSKTSSRKGVNLRTPRTAKTQKNNCCWRNWENRVSKATKPSKIEAQRLLKPSKMTPGNAHEGHHAAKRRPRASQTCLEGGFSGQKSQLGSILEAHDPPKSKPRREKIDMKKRCVFRFYFLMVQASFWKRFCNAFGGTCSQITNACFSRDP